MFGRAAVEIFPHTAGGKAHDLIQVLGGDIGFPDLQKDTAKPFLSRLVKESLHRHTSKALSAEIGMGGDIGHRTLVKNSRHAAVGDHPTVHRHDCAKASLRAKEGKALLRPRLSEAQPLQLCHL